MILLPLPCVFFRNLDPVAVSDMGSLQDIPVSFLYHVQGLGWELYLSIYHFFSCVFYPFIHSCVLGHYPPFPLPLLEQLLVYSRLTLCPYGYVTIGNKWSYHFAEDFFLNSKALSFEISGWCKWAMSPVYVGNTTEPSGQHSQDNQRECLCLKSRFQLPMVGIFCSAGPCHS
jgi:hypothetical protein